jgi:excinuclease ABC subunit B
VKGVKDIIEGVSLARAGRREPSLLLAAEECAQYESMPPDGFARLLNRLEKQMYSHARNLEFEQAAALRDRIQVIKDRKFGKAGEGDERERIGASGSARPARGAASPRQQD